MQSGVQQPDKNLCFVCKIPASDGTPHKRCLRCRTVPYCGTQCQKADWKEHKKTCVTYALDGIMNYKSSTFGVKEPKGKKAIGVRTRGEIFRDLSVWANEHNGDTLTIAAWHAMDLISNPAKADTHFLAITLRRNTTNLTSNSSATANARTLYKFEDMDVVPLTVLSEKFKNVGTWEGVPTDPLDLVRQNKAERVRDGALGCILVMSVELAPGEKKTPEQAIRETGVPILQPLGMFKVHRDKLLMMPRISGPLLQSCMKNALDGGVFSFIFQPYTPVP